MKKMFTQFLAENQKMNDHIDTLFNSQQVAIRNLEVQVGKVTNANVERQLGSLAIDTIKNPKEQVNSVITRVNINYTKCLLSKRELTIKVRKVTS